MRANHLPRHPHAQQIGRDRNSDRLACLLGDIESALALTSHAEDEISDAMTRNPAHADRIWHSFRLLIPTFDRLHYEVVYRAHCRELLHRVAHDLDTRPATSAECCVAMMHTSKSAPLKTSAVGLYLRLWDHAELPELGFGAPTRQHYEAIAGSQIDDHERWLRHTLRQDWRSVPANIEHVRLCPYTQRPRA